MKEILLSFAPLLLTVAGIAQYTYVDSTYIIGDDQMDNSVNVIVDWENNLIEVIGERITQTPHDILLLRKLDMQGEVVEMAEINFLDSVVYQGYAESVKKNGDEYVFTCEVFGSGSVLSINDDFTRKWQYREPDADTIEYSHYFSSCMLPDSSVVAIGELVYETDGTIGQDYSIAKLLTFSYEGTLVSSHIIASSKNFIDLIEVYLLADGDFLLFGAVSFDWDPVIVRVHPDGEIVYQYTWGSEWNDWLCRGIPEPDGNFTVATQSTLEVDESGNNHIYPQLLRFNPDTQEILWDHIYDNHLLDIAYLQKAIKTMDGGYALMGTAYGIPQGGSTNVYYSWILKTDSVGNEEWFKEYAHMRPEGPYGYDYADHNLYDLESTPDGGLVAAGYYLNFLPMYDQRTQTWVLKLDACGDVEWSGCTTAIAEWKMENGELKIAPNPATDVVFISSDKEFENITIRDITGKSVYTSTMNNHVLQTQVDVSMLAKGLYLVEVDFGEGRVGGQRLVVE